MKRSSSFLILVNKFCLRHPLGEKYMYLCLVGVCFLPNVDLKAPRKEHAGYKLDNVAYILSQCFLFYLAYLIRNCKNYYRRCFFCDEYLSCFSKRSGLGIGSRQINIQAST